MTAESGGPLDAAAPGSVRLLRWGIPALLAVFTVRLAAHPESGWFLGLVNLAFHEAGHLAFVPFGSTLHYLGGTLGQLAVPCGLAIYFHRAERSSRAGTALCAWWAGQNLVDISVYMADARTLALQLVGGGDHDWNELFYRFGLLGEDAVRAVANSTRCLGVLVMLLATVWTIGMTISRLDAAPAAVPGSPGARTGVRQPS